MSEEKKQTNTPASDQGAAKTVAQDLYGGQRRGNQGNQGGQGGQGGGRGPRRGGPRREERKDDLEQRILEVARVTRVMAGGKRMNFRACVALGDKKGQVGVGLGKGADVTMAVNKAVNRARKTMVTVPMVKETIPHEIYNKMGAAKLILKPAKQGRGVIAGGVTRVILELAGVKNITSKTLGSNNKINNARCTIEALKKLRKVEDLKVPKEGTKTGETSNNKSDEETIVKE